MLHVRRPRRDRSPVTRELWIAVFLLFSWVGVAVVLSDYTALHATATSPAARFLLHCGPIFWSVYWFYGATCVFFRPHCILGRFRWPIVAVALFYLPAVVVATCMVAWRLFTA